MTDKEIIKALEFCKDCSININEEILDLINRQQEQLEAAIAGQETLQKALAEKNAEIERRKNNLFCKVVIDEGKMRNIVNEKVAEFELDIESIKSEAIRAFAERLKAEQSFYDGQETRIYLTEKDLDNLVKEMVGDTE